MANDIGLKLVCNTLVRYNAQLSCRNLFLGGAGKGGKKAFKCIIPKVLT